MGASIELVGVHKDFGQLKVLENWDLVINPAERIAVLGLSGSGKTTFLRLLAGIEAPTQGRLTVVSQKTGFVFQEPRLIPWRTIRQNLLFVNEQANIDELLKTLHLEGFADYLPAQLSGGMKQRVNLARALAVSPDFSMDRPRFPDLKVKVDIMNDVMQLWQQRRFTMVTVTHDLKEALYLSDRIIISNRPAHNTSVCGQSEGTPAILLAELLALEGELLRIVCRD